MRAACHGLGGGASDVVFAESYISFDIHVVHSRGFSRVSCNCAARDANTLLLSGVTGACSLTASLRSDENGPPLVAALLIATPSGAFEPSSNADSLPGIRIGEGLGVWQY